MPVITDPAFDAQNSSPAKRPLYMLFIDGLPDSITSFVFDQTIITIQGYGLSGYSTNGYGQ